ncbi:MAG: cobalamin biosynthesis protein [Candidatus Firestonebacteria bacterium]|nr:cobalamin biosynthesis protein [Candidatus Firestonebacteria bacterium]
MSIILAYFFDIFFSDIAILRLPLHGIEIATLKLGNMLKKVKNTYVSSLLLLSGINIITFSSSLLFILLLRRISSTMEFIGEIYLIFNALSIRLPEKGTLSVYDKLYENNFALARDKLSLITEEPVENIDEHELAKTTIIATAQNTLHDFFSPIIYAFFGGGILALLCRCSYIIYHTASRNPQFDKNIRFFPGLVMDFFNYLPSRLLYLFLPLISGWYNIKYVFIDMLRNKRIYSYINDGIPIAAFFSYIRLNLSKEKKTIHMEYNIDDISSAINYMYRLSYLTMFILVILQFYKK